MVRNCFTPVLQATKSMRRSYIKINQIRPTTKSNPLKTIAKSINKSNNHPT